MNRQTELRAIKNVIRSFLKQPEWTDEKLCQLLAHAESKLSFHSCCCLIGTLTADHALKGSIDFDQNPYHLVLARYINNAKAAEEAFMDLGHYWGSGVRGSRFSGTIKQDQMRRTRIRPIIRAEIRRRDRAARVTKDVLSAHVPVGV